MTTVRVMPFADLTGTTIGTLRVLRMIARNPQPRYAVVCELCSTETTEAHSRLNNGAARCRFSGCGKPTKRRDARSEEHRAAAERENQRLAEEREASARRMQYETEDYELPSRNRPHFEVPITERQRIEFREWREQQEAERLEAERPAREKAERDQQRIAELQAEQENTLRQLHAIERERVVNGNDDAFAIDPETIKPVPHSELNAWHGAQMTQFLAENPGYHRCPENVQAIMDYFDRNAPNLKLVSAAQLTQAYRRLSEFGLLKERPTPVVAAPQRQRANITVTPEQREPETGPKRYVGRDWQTGEDREFTEREVNRLSGTEYRRAFPIANTIREFIAASMSSER